MVETIKNLSALLVGCIAVVMIVDCVMQIEENKFISIKQILLSPFVYIKWCYTSIKTIPIKWDK